MPPGEALDSMPSTHLLEQTPIILEKLLHFAAPDILQWKPAADRWSISEVLAHIVDAEQMFLERARRIVEEKSPQLTEYDQEAAYASGKYSTGTAKEHLRMFCHERDRALSMLRYLPASALARSGQHIVLGRISLSELLNEWAFHDLGHLRQIAELYRTAAFYPNCGPFQRYYNPKP
jgi:hypothetical protein